MPYLTVAGTLLRCPKDTWTLEEPETLGEEVRMADGALGSTERAAKVRASGDVTFLSAADMASFRLAISAAQDPGVPVPVNATSDTNGLLNGETLVVHARLGAMRARRTVSDVDGAVTLSWRGPLRLREV